MPTIVEFLFTHERDSRLYISVPRDKDQSGKYVPLAEYQELENRVKEAYQKFAGGHHPYSQGAVDALDYVSTGKDNLTRR